MNGDGVLTGEFFMMGDIACAEGAIAAGCRFFAGYPITPATEVAERMAERMPRVGGMYIQMEDELASMIAVLGASWGGVKAMTATSGPGLSLMLENIGLGFMTETPCVVVNVQRGGPSTGLPTLVGQGDMLQARWGSHGDYEPVAYVPSSVQEMFDYTLKAFNTAEALRMPVFLLADQVIGHMTGKVVIPPASDLEVVQRPRPQQPPGPDFRPFAAGPDGVPPMVHAGEGYNIHVTGLTHDEHGYPSINAQAQSDLQRRLLGKVRSQADQVAEVETRYTEGARLVVISYGSMYRSALRAVQMVREWGLQVGLLRLITAWPFPTEAVRRVAQTTGNLLVAELNMGQMVHPVKEVVDCPVHFQGHPGGALISPEVLAGRIQEVYR